MIDAVIVGGGLAGATLALQLARQGREVLLLEREARFRDRVRGENLLPWGVAAARRLGVLDDLVAAGAYPVRTWTTYLDGFPACARDLPTSTPDGEGALNLFHPDMQDVLLRRAAAEGAIVRRGAEVVLLERAPSRSVVVTFQQEKRRHTTSAALAVGADGRGSVVRTWAGFRPRQDSILLMVAGVLVEGASVPPDSVHLLIGGGTAVLLAPLGPRRVRNYVVYRVGSRRRPLSGRLHFRELVDTCVAAGVPERWYEGAECAGPLAEFDGADQWVDAPARHGVALIGDAAATSNPAWGCGLSLSLLDVEHLSDALAHAATTHEALKRYAEEHDRCFGALRRVLSWMTDLAWAPGPEAEERRARVMPRLFHDPASFPDFIGAGPTTRSDDEARRLVLEHD